jgi:hypothetical protein
MHKLALLLAIAAVGEGLLALHLVSQLREERASAQALQARVTELERRPPQRVSGAPSVPVTTPSAAAPFTMVKSGAPAQPPQPVTPAEPEAAAMRAQMLASFERQRALLRDPEYREAMVAQQKMIMMRMNPEMARDLELTPDQMDRLYATLGEQYVRQMEAQEDLGDVATDPEGVSARMQEANRKSAEERQANLAEIRKVLGDAKFRQFEEYMNMIGARGEASRIRESLAIAGVPLDDALALPLAKVLHEHQQKLMREATTAAPAEEEWVPRAGFISEPAGAFSGVESQQDTLDSIAKYQREQRQALARVLSPQQLKVIEEEQESSLQIQRAQLRVMEAQPQAPSSH